MAERRKGPGRPPKNKRDNTQNEEIHGVCEQCPIAVEGTYFCIIYFRPSIFKSIYNLMFNFGCTVIRIKITPRSMQLITRDHTNNNDIAICMHGDRLHSFYMSKEEVNVYVKCEQLGEAFNALDLKDVYKCYLYMVEGDNHLYISIYDRPMDIMHNYRISTINGDRQFDLPNNLHNYALSLKLDSQTLKKLINNAKNFTNVIEFCKKTENDLEIIYDSHNQTSCRTHFMSADKVEMVSNMQPGELLDVKAYIKYVYNFTKCSLGDSTSIYLDNNKPICFGTKMHFNKARQGENPKPAASIYLIIHKNDGTT